LDGLVLSNDAEPAILAEDVKRAIEDALAPIHSALARLRWRIESLEEEQSNAKALAESARKASQPPRAIEARAPETKDPETRAPETKAPETKAPEVKAVAVKPVEMKAITAPPPRAIALDVELDDKTLAALDGGRRKLRAVAVISLALLVVLGSLLAMMATSYA
jgi:hypothetical protein